MITCWCQSDRYQCINLTAQLAPHIHQPDATCSRAAKQALSWVTSILLFLSYQEFGKQCAGEKLIEHLKKWLDTTKLLETPHSWEPGQESDIAAAILELFHLLPQQASKFLETQGVSGVLTKITCHAAAAHFQHSTVRSPLFQPAMHLVYGAALHEPSPPSQLHLSAKLCRVREA